MKFVGYNALSSCTHCGVDRPVATELCCKSGDGRHKWRVALLPLRNIGQEEGYVQSDVLGADRRRHRHCDLRPLGQRLEDHDRKRRTMTGLQRGILIALPIALLLWALIYWVFG